MSDVRLFPRSVALALTLAIVLSLVVLPTLAGAQQAQPKRGGTLVVAINADPPHLNPGISTDLATLFIGGQIHSLLVRQDNDLGLIPELAERWEIGKDGLSYTLHLRKNVKWHDGKPFTSADVKYGLMDVNYKLNGPATTAFAMVQSVDTPDPYTVVFNLKFAYPPFFPWSLSTTTHAQILAKHVFEGTDPTKNEANFKPVGTGPFVFKEWVKGSHITLERNPDYFKPGLPYLDRIVFKVIPDNSARVIALEKGEVDAIVYSALPASAIKNLSKVEGIEVVDTVRPAFGEIITFFNLRQDQLKVKEVRHAINYALDLKAIVDKALDGRAIPGTSPIPSQVKEFYNPNVPKYPHDVAKANQLLDQAGFPRKADGTRFSLRISYQRGGEAGALDSAAEVMREQLKAVGITLELQPMDSAAWLDSAFVKWDFDLSMGSFSTGPDPAIGVARLYLTSAIERVVARNLMGYSNPKVDDLFKAGEREVDSAKRAVIYKDIQAQMVEDLPAIWLWEKFYPIAQKTTVKGLPSGPMHSEPMDMVWLTTAEGGPSAPPTALVVVGVLVVVAIVGGVFVVRRVRSA